MGKLTSMGISDNLGVILATKPPKTNGVLLLILAVFVVGIGQFIRYSAKRGHGRVAGNGPGVKYARALWVWGIGGVMALGLAITGIVIIAVGR